MLHILFIIIYIVICIKFSLTFYNYLSNKLDIRSFDAQLFFFSLYLVSGSFNASLDIIANTPITLYIFNHNYLNTIKDNFSDIGFINVTDDMGIVFFDFYLYQHLTNEPMSFMRNLAVLNCDRFVEIFAHDHQMLKDCILEYNHQKYEAIRESHATLVSLVNSVVERVQVELNINLLELHSIDKWIEIYIQNLEEVPRIIDGCKYNIYYDSQLNISYLANQADYLTFDQGIKEMNIADNILDLWDSQRPDYLKAIFKGLIIRPSPLLSEYGDSFRKAFVLEKEIERLNTIDADIFN